VKSTPGTVTSRCCELSDAALSAFLPMTNETYRPTVPAELQTPTKAQAPRRRAADQPHQQHHASSVSDTPGRAGAHGTALSRRPVKAPSSCAGVTATSPARGLQGTHLHRASLGGQLHAMVENRIHVTCRRTTPPPSRPLIRAPHLRPMRRPRQPRRRARRRCNHCPTPTASAGGQEDRDRSHEGTSKNRAGSGRRESDSLTAGATAG